MRSYIIIFIYCTLLFSTASIAQKPEVVFQTGHQTAISGLSFSSDSRFLASGASESVVVIWEVESGKQFASLQLDGICRKIFFSKQEKTRLYCLDQNGNMSLWNTESAEKVDQFQVDQTTVDFLVLSKEEILLGGENILKYNLVSRQTSVIAKGVKCKDLISVVDNKLLVLDVNKRISEVDFSNGQILQSLKSNSGSVVYSTSSGSCYGIGPNAIAYLYNRNKSGNLSELSYKEKGKKYGFNAIVETEKYIYCGGGEEIVYEYDKGNFSSRQAYGHRSPITALAVDHDQKYIASASSDHSIVLWDAQTLKKVRDLNGSYNEISALKFSSNGNGLAVASLNGSLKYWDLTANQFSTATINLEEFKRKSGWKNAIIGLDSVTENAVYFSYAEYKTVWNADQIRHISYFSGVWNWTDNKILLSENGHNKFKLNSGSRKVLNDFVKDSFEKSGRQKHLDHILKHNVNRRELADVDKNDRFNFYAVALKSGAIAFYSDGAKVEKLVEVSLFGQSDFYISDSQGRYFATKPAINLVHIRNKGNLYNIGQLDAFYNRPDLILAALPYFDKTEIEIISAAVKSNQKNLKLNYQSTVEELFASFPEVEVASDFNSSTGTIQLQFSNLKKDNKLALVLIKQNGVPVRQITAMPENGSITVELSAAEGRNSIEVSGLNGNGLAGLPRRFEYYFEAKSSKLPRLYFVGVGVSEYVMKDFNLRYALKDVNDLSGVFLKSKAYSDVRSQLLLNETATANEIIKAISELTKEISFNDVFIFYYAGHGILNSSFDYFLATHDVDFNKPDSKGLSYEELMRTIDNIPVLNRLVILDACHSGEIDKDEVEGKSNTNTQSDGELAFRSVGTSVLLKRHSRSAFELSRQIFVDTRSNNGTLVISSAGGLEFAMESGKLQNGVFTYVFMQALSTKSADLNKDNRITLKELENYLPGHISEATNGKQRAQVRVENPYLNFRLK